MRRARLFKSKGFGLDRFGSVRGKKEEMEEGIGLFLGGGSPFTICFFSFLFYWEGVGWWFVVSLAFFSV